MESNQRKKGRKTGRKKSNKDNLPIKIKKYSFIALLMAVSGISGYKFHDFKDSMKRNAIIKDMIENTGKGEEKGKLKLPKAIYATELNRKTGNDITYENVSFDLNNYMNFEGNHYALQLITTGEAEYLVLKNVNSSDKNAYVLTVDVSNGETNFSEQTAEYKGEGDSRYLNVYSEGEKEIGDNYQEYVINGCADIINPAIAYAQPKSFRTKWIGKIKLEDALRDYFKYVPTEYLEIIAKSINEKGVIDPSLYGMIDPSLYMNNDINVSDQDVAESLDTDEWKAGLRVEEPGPISISEAGEEKKGNEDREN